MVSNDMVSPKNIILCYSMQEHSDFDSDLIFAVTLDLKQN